MEKFTSKGKHKVTIRNHHTNMISKPAIIMRRGEHKCRKWICIIKIDPNAFTVVTEEGKRIPGNGPWTLYAGFGGPDLRTRELTGNGSASLYIAEEK